MRFVDVVIDGDNYWDCSVRGKALTVYLKDGTRVHFDPYAFAALRRCLRVRKEDFSEGLLPFFLSRGYRLAVLCEEEGGVLRALRVHREELYRVRISRLIEEVLEGFDRILSTFS